KLKRQRQPEGKRDKRKGEEDIQPAPASPKKRKRGDERGAGDLRGRVRESRAEGERKGVPHDEKCALTVSREVVYFKLPTSTKSTAMARGRDKLRGAPTNKIRRCFSPFFTSLSSSSPWPSRDDSPSTFRFAFFLFGETAAGSFPP